MKNFLEIRQIKELIDKATAARGFAYAPYSNFLVGAALLICKNQIYTGCNIESASYSPSNCAERTAFFKAVSEGERDFLAIAIVGGAKLSPVKQLCPPCGVCRQVMMEFCDVENFKIILGISSEHYSIFNLIELLPMGFGPKNLALEGN
jgi:cytidine deaminase